MLPFKLQCLQPSLLHCTPTQIKGCDRHTNRFHVLSLTFVVKALFPPHDTDLFCPTLNLVQGKEKKKSWLKQAFLSARNALQGRRRLEEQTLNFCVELRSLFLLSVHLILCLFGSHPKKTKAIISIQFVPSPCMSTDRLSYFGHAPRGELREAGGQINGYYLSHRLITEHLDPGARTHRRRAEGTAESVIDNWCSFILHHHPP